MTSLIPTVLDLSEFFKASFPNFWWYSNWYLGVPFNFLTGPVVPFLLSIFNSYLILIFLSFIISAIGIYFLVKSFNKDTRQAILASIIFLLMPFGYFLLNYQNGLNQVAFSFVPYLFVFYKNVLEQKKNNWILLSIAISFVILINLSTLLSIIIGFAVLYYVLKGKEADEEKIIKSTLSILLSLSIATIWYTPRFWFVTLTNPSVGGVPLFNLLWSVFNFLFNFVPILLVIVFFRWRKYKPKDNLLIFSFVFFFSYLLLSLVRFLGDPKFIQDWTSYLYELSFALSIMASFLFFKIKEKNTVLSLLFLSVFIVLSVICSLFSIKSFFNSNTEYVTRISKWLKIIGKDERVFLSGSSVFWINEKLNVMQVRGGKDSSSLAKTWADAAYQIREGKNVDLTKAWLAILGAGYVLVNDTGSEEYYRDFKTPDKFSSFNIVAKSRGDTLYNIPNVWVGRVAKESILNVQPYTNGADLNSLSFYKSSILRKADFSYINPQKIRVNASLNKNEMASLAVSFDPNFKLVKGEGDLLRDSYGNIAILPWRTGFQIFEIAYEPNPLGFILPFLASILILLVLKYYAKIFPRLKGRVNLHLGVFEEEEY